MTRKLRFSGHASCRVGGREILRRWVFAATRTRPRIEGRRAIFELSAFQLSQSFGGEFASGLRVVIDRLRRKFVTIHWIEGSN